MIKQGDRVRVGGNPDLVRVVSSTTPRGVLVRVDGNELEIRHEEIELLCAVDELDGSPCPRGAELFVRKGQRPICPVHAAHGLFAPSELADTREDPAALVSCACGESMDRAPSAGTWTLSGVACEYRTCMHCGSSRPYMPADEVSGRAIGRYDDPHSSEVSDEWSSLTEALFAHPPVNDRSVLIRNGVTLARAFRAVDGSLGWHVQKPERESGFKV